MPQPSTSKKAFQHIQDSGKRQTHAEIITECLKSGFSGNYEAIALRCGLTPMQVVRRLSECQNVRKSGKHSKTISGQMAEVWEYHDPNDIESAGDLIQGALFAA